MIRLRPGRLPLLIACAVVGAGVPRLAMPVQQDALEPGGFEHVAEQVPQHAAALQHPGLIPAPQGADRIERASPGARAPDQAESGGLAGINSPGAGESLLFAGVTVLDDAVMDGLRGGFETPGGLMLSFGIERLVYINGELLSTTSLNVADLGTLVGGSAEAAKALTVGSTVGLIQNGPNNTFDASMISSGAFATVIQNTLNDQTILSVTTINATVNSMDMLQANRIGDSLKSTVNSALFR